MQGLTTPGFAGYDPEKPNNYVLHLDANNLSGWAKSHPLPSGDFRWEDCNKLAESFPEHPIDSSESYILEVDLDNPKELHEVHNAYPPAPERMVVQKEWMSKYQYGLGKRVVPTEIEKLVPNLHNKERYVLHYRNHQLYLSLCMPLKKVHRALCFKQSPCIMESYIKMNTEF